ncbi:MAG: DNA replication and repair protein RecF [Spirochaetia bacterium]|jgi:DNA replication and repair protein RecF|nr:DNA replication and repair protein RecF [Spirochaetia bacterium]
MPFSYARFVSFRNLEDSEVDTKAERIFLIGENGQGKTNFLEALYYLCYGSSFRGSVDQQIPATGSRGFGLAAAWNSLGNSEDSELENGISIRYDGQAKDIRLNGKSLKDRKELVFHNPAVVFCHEDFSFAAGDPERRRFFFDQCAGMLYPGYIDSLRSYKRILKQRNAALKESAYDLLDVLDPQLVRFGLALMEERRKLLRRFQKDFPRLYEYVSRLGRPVELAYASSWQREADFDGLLAHLGSRRESEILYGTTRSGPHRDRWDFSSDEGSFTDRASTGQLRLLSLILRIIQASAVAGGEDMGEGADIAVGSDIAVRAEANGGAEAAKGIKAADASDPQPSGGRKPRWPILLLDDVLLELDVGRRRRFLELLPPPGQGAQAFFTFLPEEPWTEYENGDTIVYRVHNGRFENQKRL